MIFILCILAFLATGCLADPVTEAPLVTEPVLVQRQLDLMLLFYHLHEPNPFESCKNISSTWSFEENIDRFDNVTAVTIYMDMLEHNWNLPKAVPFSIHQPQHLFEAVTMFNVLFSAKDYGTFYKATVYSRDRVNEYLFSYVLSTAIIHRKDTRGIFLPHIYEILPSFFNNGEILTTAQRINIHGLHNVEYYPFTYKWNNEVVIRENYTNWVYDKNQFPMFYFTHDYELNAFYYYLHIAYPNWLGSDVVPMEKDRRGEWFWFTHKEIVAHYYMQRLSNGQGEIPELGPDYVKVGYNPGLLYISGIPFPARPNYYHFNQPELMNELQAIRDYERRVRDAVDQGYIVNNVGEHINLSVPQAIEVLGRVIEANVDSPNANYYKDFISIWKRVLGGSFVPQPDYHHFIPLVVPSVLEHHETALRDPAFYMIWKRVLGLFQSWQEHLPPYKHEELALPGVAIQDVEVDKLVTYFEHVHFNVSSYLHSTEDEARGIFRHNNALIERSRLNHKVFQIRVQVNSEVAKTVAVRFFLAPKYDSKGHEIPLHINSQNFFLFDEFVYDLPAGESIISRDSIENAYTRKDGANTYEVYKDILKALSGKEELLIDQVGNLLKWPHRLILPKGRAGGMPFLLMVYISEYHPPAIPYGTGFDPRTSLGVGTGARFFSADPFGFPVNRPLHTWEVVGLSNLVLKDVMIYHK